MFDTFHRLGQAIIYHLTVIVGMILLMTFFTTMMIEAMPGGYCNTILPDHASAQVREACRQHTPSVFTRYVQAITRLLHLDLGHSLMSHQPVSAELADHLPSTLMLTFATLCISLPFGISGGLVAAWSRHTLLGWAINFTAIGLLALPPFVIAFVLFNVFVVQYGWLSVLDNAHVKDLIMPVFALAIPLSVAILRITRNTVIQILHKDYIRTAYARGLHSQAVLVRHVLPNVAGALLDFFVLILIGLLDGTLIVEIIFVRPGLGRYTLTALTHQDYPALQGVVLVVTVLTSIVSMSAEIVRPLFLPQCRS